MKVIHIIADGSVGGGATHVLQLLRRTYKTLHCSLVTQSASYLAKEASGLGVPVFELEFSGTRVKPLLPLRLHAILSESAPDIVHVHGGRAGFFMSLVPNRRPVVYTLHGLHGLHKRWPLPIFGACAERLVMQRANHVVFVSDYDRRRAANWCLLPKYRTYSVIHNGIQPDEIPYQTSSCWDLAFVGRLTGPKDPMLFLRAMSLLPNYTGVMVGGGDLEGEVSEAIRRWKLRDRLEVKGALCRDETLALLGQVRVLVMTSRWEGLPIVALEAMAAGVPVVATNVGGLPEILGGENGGLLVHRTARDIADAVTRILEDPSLAARLADNGRMRLREEFSEDAMLKKLLCVYEQASGRPNGTFPWPSREESGTC